MKIRSLFFPIVLLITSSFSGALRAQEVDVNFFYTSLQDKGDWFHTDKYGYVFQPRRATQDRAWRPYVDGHWGYTDQGWTWISNEDFGWATYHYGRWALIANTGWVWVPGDQWGPAWVSWRTPSRYANGATVTAVVTDDADSDYIGWAPLPPEAVFDVSVGFTGRVDAEYDIGPANYCFVPTRSFTAPVLTAVIVPTNRNVVFISRTVNVTNVARVNRGGATLIFNGGPEVTNIERVVQHPVQRLTIESMPATAYSQKNVAGAHLADQVRGNSFQVIAPQVAVTGIFRGGAGAPPQQASGPRPAKVKGELKQVQRNSGWDQPGADAKAVQTAREQVKREEAQAPKQAAVPEPNANPAAPNPAATGGRPPANAAPTPPVGTASRPSGGTPDPRNPASQVAPAQPTQSPETVNAPPTTAPQTKSGEAPPSAPTPVPHRESEATAPIQPPVGTTPQRQAPGRESPKPQDQPRQRPPAETQRREANRPPQPDAATESRSRPAPKSEAPPAPRQETQREDRPAKPDAPRSEQAEKANPNPPPADKPRQPAGDTAREKQSARPDANQPAEAQKKPEAHKKPETTPAPTS